MAEVGNESTEAGTANRLFSEAIAAGTPILCTSIPGNLGLLGNDWPGAFPVGDATALAALIERAATEKSFLDDLCLRTRKMQSMVDPSTERQAWHALLHDLSLS